MTEPPKLVSASEMEKLFSEQHKRIAECQIQTIEVLAELSHDFPYKEKTISLFRDPLTDDVVVRMTDYTRHDGTKSRVISSLLIGDTLHELEIPEEPVKMP